MDYFLSFLLSFRHLTKMWQNRSCSGLLFMGYQVLLFVFVCCSLRNILAEGNVTVIVRGSMAIAETDENYICATIDWWPPEKCDFGHCPWGKSSILNLDINNPVLENAIKAFGSLRIRIGGTLQDRITYGAPGLDSECFAIAMNKSGLFEYSDGCLPISRWDEVNAVFRKTGAMVTFGINALYGRYDAGSGLWEGSWNSTNARNFMQYTASKGYPVDSWEFGNELSGSGIGARVSSAQYAKDLIELNAVVNELYNDSHFRPLVVAPGGFFNQLWFAEVLDATGPNILDVVTYHMYNLGSGDDPHLVDNIIDPHYLGGAANTFRDVQITIERHGPWSSAWVGESGGAHTSGGYRVSNTFLNSFWYLDQLGMAAKYNTKVYCRQTLIGGNYGLIDTDSFVPNPDYYSALLWRRLMGKKVLSTDITGYPSLKAYAHCRKKGPGISVLLINLSKTTMLSISVRNDLNVDHAVVLDGPFKHGLKRTVSWIGRALGEINKEEYHLTAKDGNHRTQTMLLNGMPLKLTDNGEIPEMNPVITGLHSDIRIAPLSIAFVVLPDFEAGVCV